MSATARKTSASVPPGATRRTSRSFSRGRRWSSRARWVVDGLLAIYCVVVFNVIVYRHPARFDLTGEKLYSLSDDTLAKLRLVKEEIDVIVPFHYQPDNPQHMTDARVLQRTLDLLKEYNAKQPLIRLVDKINVFHEPDRWDALSEQFGLAKSQVNRVIFLAGRGGAYKRALTPADLADMEPPPDPALPARIRAFRGEEAITGAIVQLTRRDERKVYFTQGHGEPALRTQRGGTPAMLGAVTSDLESSGYKASELFLLREDGVPRDASLVIVAGPTHPFSPKEIELLEKYLLEDGRLFVALGSERSGIEDLLERWGVQVLDGRLGERYYRPGRVTDDNWVRVTEINPGQAITSPFGSTFDMLLLSPRPLRSVPGQRTHRTDPLLGTHESTEEDRIVVRDVDEGELNAKERRGAVTVATATYPDSVDRPPPGWVERRSRMVVVGASNFLHDYDADAQVLGGYRQVASHRPFFMNCVYWLTEEESLLSRGGHESLRRELPPLDADLRRFLFLASVVIFPGVFALLGIGVYFWRRA